MATYPELPAPARARLALASHAATMAWINDDPQEAQRAEARYRRLCETYGVDPDQTLTYL